MSMKISGMSDFRVETEWPCAIGIERHEYDLSAYVFLAPYSDQLKPWRGQQVKVFLKDNTLGVFVSAYPDTDLPEHWRDAEILWEYNQVPDSKEAV